MAQQRHQRSPPRPSLNLPKYQMEIFLKEGGTVVMQEDMENAQVAEVEAEQKEEATDKMAEQKAQMEPVPPVVVVAANNEEKKEERDDKGDQKNDKGDQKDLLHVQSDAMTMSRLAASEQEVKTLLSFLGTSYEIAYDLQEQGKLY